MMPPGPLESKKDDLMELLNVSQIVFNFGTHCFPINVTIADGQKCERCWHWETDIGQNAAHPTICARCTKAVLELKT